MEDRKDTGEERVQHKEKKNGGEAAKAKSPKDLIRESIITVTDETQKENKSGAAQNPDDVLAFSRSVNKIDSSLD